MAITFLHYRASGNIEYPVTINRVDINNNPVSSECYLFEIDGVKHSETSEINSVHVEIIDNKPLFIPLGRTGPTYKFQFKTHTIAEYNMWYTVLGNDILLVGDSDYPEFPVGTFWVVETITDQEMPGSAFSKSSLNGKQYIHFEYEVELTISTTDAAGKERQVVV